MKYSTSISNLYKKNVYETNICGLSSLDFGRIILCELSNGFVLFSE